MGSKNTRNPEGKRKRQSCGKRLDRSNKRDTIVSTLPSVLIAKSRRLPSLLVLSATI